MNKIKQPISKNIIYSLCTLTSLKKNNVFSHINYIITKMTKNLI